MTDHADQADRAGHRFTVDELAALMEGTAGVSVDPDALTRQPGSGFDTFGLDSLGLLGIVAQLEQRYGRGLPEDAERCRTPGEFIAMVNDALRTGV